MPTDALHSRTVVSRYERGDNYLELTHDSYGYAFQGRRCGGGFGKDRAHADVMAEFARMVRQERVELAHVAGEAIPAAPAAPGLPMTTAELKRRIKVGDRWLLERPQGGESGFRTIVKVQSEDFASLREGHEDKRGNWTWMNFVKSARLRDLGDGKFAVLSAENGQPWLVYTPA